MKAIEALEKGFIGENHIYETFDDSKVVVQEYVPILNAYIGYEVWGSLHGLPYNKRMPCSSLFVWDKDGSSWTYPLQCLHNLYKYLGKVENLDKRQIYKKEKVSMKIIYNLIRVIGNNEIYSSPYFSSLELAQKGVEAFNGQGIKVYIETNYVLEDEEEAKTYWDVKKLVNRCLK